MPRPREFDIDVALDKSMQVFWKQGYKATSMEDLMQVTQLNKQSLYCAFGDKRNLFLKALERYRLQSLSNIKAALAQEKSPFNALQCFFQSMVPNEKCDGEPSGCLMMSATHEFGISDPEITAQINKMHQGFEKLLADVIQQGQKKREITTKFESIMIAKTLITLLSGLHIAKKRGETSEALKNVLDFIFEAIKA